MCARLKRDRYRRMSSPSFRRSPIWCHSGRMKSRLACRSAGHIRGRAKRAGRLTISATDSKPADGVFVPTDEDPAEHEHVHRLKNKRKTGMLVWRSRRRYSRLVQGSLESLNVPIIGYLCVPLTTSARLSQPPTEGGSGPRFSRPSSFTYGLRRLTTSEFEFVRIGHRDLGYRSKNLNDLIFFE